MQVAICQECIQWTVDEKHTFLKQALEVCLLQSSIEKQQSGFLDIYRFLFVQLIRDQLCLSFSFQRHLISS